MHKLSDILLSNRPAWSVWGNTFYVSGHFYDEDYDDEYDYDDNYIDTVYGSKKEFSSGVSESIKKVNIINIRI